uniref:Leucine rich repeat protein n=1 Tax=Siphoviridae sp. ct0Bp21 TaxID=2825291 RepID=A0A8S5V2X1_9CAUD|nr:MAG TPA: leucine rich repeat protein [Siphoviridae sp. ct0Bp21]
MGVTAHALFYFIDGRMIMADTVSFDSLLNTTTGMTAIVNNKKHDDDVVSVTGVDWFTYAGKTASTIYVSGNNFIGFGQNAEQLKIWRRDGAIYYVYRQEGTLTSGKRFLKIRVEGYVYYSSTSSSYALKYEVFLIEGQTLFINVVQRPTSSSYTGTSSITDGKATTNLTLSVSSTVPVSILVKNAGISQAVSYEKFVDTYITGITVSKMPDKTTYYQGELFDSTGLEVSKTYSDGALETITDYELSGFDSSSPGTKTITVTASGKTTTFEITVSESSITAISVTTMPTKVNYHIGKEFDSTGIVVTATLSDGNTIDVTKDCTYSGFDSSSPKQCGITVTYGNFTCTFEVTIMQPERISNIESTSGIYFVGDTTDVKVTAITVEYSDGSERIESGYVVENKVLSESGTIPISVKYFNVIGVVNVSVYSSLLLHIGSPNYEDVTANFDPSTNTLTVSGTGKITDSLSDNLENINIPNDLYTRCTTLLFEDGIAEIVGSFSGDFKSLTDINFPNTITYIDTDSFPIFLGTRLEIPASVSTIYSDAFKSCPNLTEIVFHEGLEEIGEGSFEGCNSLKNIVFPESLWALDYAFSDITLDYIEIGRKNIAFDSNIRVPDCKNLTIRGGDIDQIFYTNSLENLTLKKDVVFSRTSVFSKCSALKSVTIENGITVIPAECFKDTQLANVSIPASVSSIGENAFKTSVTTNITLNKKTNEISGSPWGATGTITWLILATRIEVSHMPTKTRYFVGEPFDATGLVITAYYADNTSTQTTGYTLSSPDMSVYGNKTVTVTFDEKTVDFSILVVDISGIEVKTMPVKTEYPKGDVFDTTGLSILVKYTDVTSETITTGFEVSGFDSSSVGEKTITVTYKTHTATFKVTVYDLSGIRITSFPSKVYYKIGETFDPSGLTVAEVRQDGTEKEITDYDISGFDSSTAGSKTITVSYNATVNGTSKFVGSDSFQIKVTNDGKNPFDDSSSGGSGEVEEEKTEPINVTVHWINGEFADLTNENIDQNTLTLQESICSESYFIFGGCVCNQITFQAHHDQFNGTSEEFYPHGKIEVYIERKGTRIKIFTGEIDSAERKANSLTRNFIAYDYLYKLRNTDIARWYKNQTTDKKKKLTQKQFRDKLFEFLGLEQVSTKLHCDDAYVPDTNNSNEMNVVNILKDLCLQNDRFGWMNRDGKFEYLKLRQNSYRYGQTTGNQNIYKYYNNEEVHLDTFKSFTAKEGRIWFPNIMFCDPDPNRAFGFTQGDYTAQEAYDNNVYYNRNSFFVGNEDWLNYVWDADEYGGISRAEPIMKICYGVFVNQDLRKYYRAQGYTAEVQGNPLNMVGQAVELYYKKQIQHDDQEPTELQWYVHSYIMSRTLKIGATDMIDTYSANNAPFNSNSRQLGKDTPEISATVNRTRSEMPTISYAEFTDGSDSEFSPAMIDDFTDGSGGSGSTSEQLKKAQLRCVKRIKKADYDALVSAGTDRADTLYFTFEEK